MPLAPGEPVYFLSLELQNVGAFGPEPVEIKFTREDGSLSMWTLILGENGIGKTTALECLLGLTPLPGDSKLAMLPSIHAMQWVTNRYFNRYKRVEDWAPLRIATQVIPVDEIQQRRPARWISLNIEYGNPDGRGNNIVTDNALEQYVDWPGVAIHGYRAARDIDFDEARFPEREASSLSNDINGALRVNPPVSVDEWLVQLHHAALVSTATTANNQYENVRALLVEVLPGVSDIRATIPTSASQFVRIEYRTESGWVGQWALGLGYRSVMGLIGDLAYRLYTAYPNSPEPLKEPAVVLIDEIDLHLHPKWQRDLIRVLSERFPKVQFIATAHSPLMVQAAAGHNLALLYRDPETKQVRVDNNVDNIANWRLDQIVTSDLFGLPSAVRPQLDPEIRRRDEILAKETLTDEDRDEVRKIEAQLGEVPLGTTEEARRMNDLLRRTLDVLEKKAAG